MAIFGPGLQQFIVPCTTTFEKLQGGYLWMVVAIVRCGQRPQPMKSQGGYLLLDATIVHCGYTKLLMSHREAVYD